MDKLHQFLEEYGKDQKSEQQQLSRTGISIQTDVKSQKPKISRARNKTTKLSPILNRDLITNNELHKYLCISKRTLANYRKSCLLPFQKFGGKIYYRKKDIDRIFEING